MSHVLKTLNAMLAKKHGDLCVLCRAKDYRHQRHSFPTEERGTPQADLFLPCKHCT